MIVSFVIEVWNIQYSQTLCLLVQCLDRDNCAQTYSTEFGCARVHPMTSRSEAHETLSLLFARDSALLVQTCNSTKEMIHAKFYQKLKDAAYQLKQFEPYTLWSNVAEREIMEHRKEAYSKLIWSNTSKCLQDYCFELKADIRLNTAHDIYKLDKEVPETVMSGEASGITSTNQSGYV